MELDLSFFLCRMCVDILNFYDLGDVFDDLDELLYLIDLHHIDYLLL